MKSSIVTLVFFLSMVSFGQESSKIDSLIKLSKFDEAIHLAYKSLEIIKKKSSPSLLGNAQCEIANIYFKKGNYDSTYHYAKKALALGIKHDLPEVITAAYVPIGNIHYSKFEDLDAIAAYQKIDSISKHSGIKNKNVVRAMFNLGEVLLRTYSVQDTSYISKAEGYFRRAVNIASEIDDEYYENYGYILIGNIYGQRKEYEKAMPFYEKSIIYFRNSGFVEDLARVYWSLGIINTDLKQYDKANDYYKLRLKILTQTGEERNIAAAKRGYGGFLYRIGNYKNAIPYFLDAHNYYKTSDKIGILVGTTYNLAESYFKTEDFKNSSKFYRLTIDYIDSLETRKQRNLALDLEKKYQTEKKEQEIALLEAEKKNIEIQKSNQRNLFLAGFGVIAIAGIFLFLTLRNRQKTNKKLKELDTAKSRFFENISHEFRTPLSLINGPIEEQLRKDKLDPQEKRNLTIAKTNSNRLLTLVDQILDLSKLESDHYKLQVQTWDLAEFLKATLSSFKYQAEVKNLDFISSIDISGQESWFDRDVLEKIVTNLVGNAVKYTPEGHKISVLAEIKNKLLQLKVKNTGVTLTKEELANIFSRFHRAHENATGTGIGLALTKELVELHKGNITANSDETSINFVVTIPIEEKVFTIYEKVIQKASQEEILKGEEISVKTISNEGWVAQNREENPDDPILLIVDDNGELREYLSSLFTEDFTIKTAADGKEGFEKALQYVPDVIITDLMMPNEDGLQLTKKCKTHLTTSHIPVMMLTAKAGDENKLEGIEIGADTYITKPFNTEILKATVKNLLESRKKLQERFSQEVVLTPKEISVSSYDEQFLGHLQEVMDNKLVESDFSAENFAVALGMSRMQLHRKLKALTGLSTTEFIRSQRLKLAAQLLKKSEINISQVGYAVGFNNHSYFTKCFREQFGVSPSDFVKS